MPSIRSLCIFATTALAAFSTVSAAATPKHARNDVAVAAASSKHEVRDGPNNFLGNAVDDLLDDVVAIMDELLGNVNERRDGTLPPPDTVKRDGVPLVGGLVKGIPLIGPLLNSLIGGVPPLGSLVGTPEAGAGGGALISGLLGKLKSPADGQRGVASVSAILQTATTQLGDVSKQLDVLTAGKSALPIGSLLPILQTLVVILLNLVHSLGRVAGGDQTAALGGLGVGGLATLVFGVIQTVVVILSGVLGAAGPGGAAGVLNVITGLIGPLVALLLTLVVQLVPGVANILSGLLPTICGVIPEAVLSIVPGVCIGN